MTGGRYGPPRVVTSCSGRFHIFDQARELARHGMLYQLITDYPAARPAYFGVPREQVTSLLITGMFDHGLRRVMRWLPQGMRSPITHAIHGHFSRRLAHVLPADMDFFIGLSSFCREALARCRERGVPCAVDHGSLHQAEDARLVREEAARWGIPPPADTSPDWIIAKEDEEFALADHVFVLSAVARDSLVRQGVDSSRIFVNPCGVDIAAFSPAPRRDEVFRVIQVGAISLRKGTLDLLEAFRRAALPKSELWFVGGGREESGLDAVIGRMDMRGVSFLPPVPQSSLRGYYNHSSVFVLASVADGFGMVVPQAMACGLPVIVTENVGARDLIEDGVNGFVVPIHSPDLIAERLRYLHDNPEEAKRMGQSALVTVRSGFAWSDYGDRLAAFFANRLTA